MNQEKKQISSVSTAHSTSLKNSALFITSTKLEASHDALTSITTPLIQNTSSAQNAAWSQNSQFLTVQAMISSNKSRRSDSSNLQFLSKFLALARIVQKKQTLANRLANGEIRRTSLFIPRIFNSHLVTPANFCQNLTDFNRRTHFRSINFFNQITRYQPNRFCK